MSSTGSRGERNGRELWKHRGCRNIEEKRMSDEKKTLYDRLGGYEAITAGAKDLLPPLQADPQPGRFWAHRGEGGGKRGKQLLVVFLCARAGVPADYLRRGLGH